LFQLASHMSNLCCRYAHPPRSSYAVSLVMPYEVHHPQPQKGSVAFFWDIENVHIPRMQNPSHIVQRLRDKFVHSPQSLEIGFDYYKCDTSRISRSVLAKLHHANVRIVDYPTTKQELLTDKFYSI
jgi:hypothetical protein